MRSSIAPLLGMLLGLTLLVGCEQRSQGSGGDAGPGADASELSDAGPVGDASPGADAGDPDAGADVDAGTDAGANCVDLDGDGYGVGCSLGPDCDDGSAMVHPDRDEIPFNGVDDDCDPASPDDLVFDPVAMADQATAQCSFTNPRQVLDGLTLLDVWDVSYVSWESIGGELSPIVIRAFAARPAGVTGSLPGVVQAHGLGGYAKERHATGLASLLGMHVLAYTGPGGAPPPGEDGATSEGLPAGHANGTRMFDTLPDLRGSWFWGHASAAMRGLTCLESLAPAVDPARLGITGFSAGGVMSLIVAGADARVQASVPHRAPAPGRWPRPRPPPGSTSFCPSRV